MLHRLVVLCISEEKSWCHNDVNGTKWYWRPWKQKKSHGKCMWYSCHVICNTDTAFIAVFHGPALSSTGRYEGKYRVTFTELESLIHCNHSFVLSHVLSIFLKAYQCIWKQINFRCQASCVAVTTAIALMLQKNPRNLKKNDSYDIESIVGECYTYSSRLLTTQAEVNTCIEL